ncbi:MAG: hypothetical protein R2684_09810 [Pyrinomonadaceae bacterium]
MVIALICLSLSLAGITGLQFFYLAYLDRVDKEQKRRIRELEVHCRNLSDEIYNSRIRIAELKNPVSELDDEILEETEDNEVWADLIEET